MKAYEKIGIFLHQSHCSIVPENTAHLFPNLLHFIFPKSLYFFFLFTVSLISGHSKSKIQRIFKHYLATPPVFTIPQKERVHIILDGTYFSNDICLVVYRNNDIRCTQLYRLSNNEHYEEIREDLENLKALNIQIDSVTRDGHRAILKAVRKVFKG